MVELMSLHTSIIRLASANPALRPHLLPILRAASEGVSLAGIDFSPQGQNLFGVGLSKNKYTIHATVQELQEPGNVYLDVKWGSNGADKTYRVHADQVGKKIQYIEHWAMTPKLHPPAGGWSGWRYKGEEPPDEWRKSLREAKSTSIRPEPKDYKRINDMINKARDEDHVLQLARNMANAITDGPKAMRRARAAEAANWHDMADIFYERARDLGY